ncbi:MAG: hypothetical protein ACR2QG_07885 [Gammaproteobacteria bacterium]
MKNIHLLTCLFTTLLLSPISYGSDASACMNCHDDGEFSGLSAADILADLRDPGIPPHKRFDDYSDEELQAIAAELTGG